MGLEIVGLLLASAGASYGWWRLQTRRERVLSLTGQRFEDSLDGDAKVILHVAHHAARSREHAMLLPLHLLYGISQDEAFQTAVAKIEGNAEALDKHLMDELDKVRPGATPTGMTPYQRALGMAYVSAQQQFQRLVRCVDIFVYLFRAEETRELLRPCTPTPHALLFALVHGMAEPPATLPDRTDVHVVLRNDDYTTREFVSAMLREELGLPAAEAETRMMKTHEEGRAIVGRFKLDEATLKVEAVRKRARESFYPLWIGLEDC